MAGWKRRVLGIAVISAGVCAAMPFRNEAGNAPIDAGEAVESPGAIRSREELTLQLTLPTTPIAAPIPAPTRQGVPPVAEKKQNPQPQELRRDALQAPPSIASTFEPLAAAVPVTAEVAVRKPNLDMPERRHRIADGDTLEGLAQRYLGDRQQWRLIFEANGGLLANRDILPIGKEIKIPHAPTSSLDDDDHLVPIPPELLNRD